ncbi:MAG: SDR family NAD(P)-dependent oxidoreductase [Chloroflexi bacterium]|nr:SDR family NAD(P)-dependent oxidoreductase [Chloroflexota bacterium]
MKTEFTAAFSGKRAVVTGGLGFIGSNIVHYLVEAGAEVVIIDSLDPRSGGDIRNIQGIEDRIELVSADIVNFDPVATIVERAAYVFHCAAHTSHPYSMRDPQRDIEVNCIGTVNVLEAIRRFRPKAKLVYVGTSTQIGQMQTRPVTESHPVAPVDIYSANKSVAEHYCRIYANAYDLGVNVVRLPNVYGPYANISNPDFGFINYFIGRALRNETLTIYGNGLQLRSILYAGDAVTALALAAQTDRTGQIWFAAGAQSISVKELAEAIVEACGTGRVVQVEWPEARKKIDVGDIVIDSSKIRAELGWGPAVSLSEGLRSTVEFFRR